MERVADARRIERAIVGRDLLARTVVRYAHLKRQRGPKGSTAHGRRAHAPLHYQRVGVQAKVRSVHPKDPVRLGVVQAHVIDGYVNARLVHTSKSQVAVSESIACVA